MKISHVRISNILGIDQLEFDAGQFNEISGANGLGKTSVLEAIKSVFQGGHDATLLRNGAEKGEIVLVLDDGQEITKRVTETGSDTVLRRDGKHVNRPAAAIKALTDLLSINPVDFLLAKPKERAKVLLESMPLEADPARIEAITGQKVKATGLHALVVIGEARQQLFDMRTEINRAARQKESTVEQLRQALPELPEGVETGDEDALREQIEEARRARDEKLEKIAAKLARVRDEARISKQAIDDKLAEDIQKLRDAAETERAAVGVILSDNEKRAAEAKAKASDECVALTSPLEQAVAVIKSNRDAAAKREASLKIIDQMDAEAVELRSNSDGLTQALDELEAYKQELLAELPIDGLEIRDGELYRNGVHLDRLNTAQQVQIAVELAKLRAGDLAVCCVDRLELLDTETFQQFRDGMQGSGLQMFVTRVTDGDFQIAAE